MDSGNSFNPIMGTSIGAEGHSLFGTSLQPTLRGNNQFLDYTKVSRFSKKTHASNSESSKILWGSLSTKTSKLFSNNVFAVVGVSADRCSKGFFSHLNHIGCLGAASADEEAVEDWTSTKEDILYELVERSESSNVQIARF